jgi:predicted transcriptional regulator
MMILARGENLLKRMKRVPGDEAGVILIATASRPMTPRQLSEMLNIPIVNCYRKIRHLESLGLLTKAATLYANNGKGVTLYSSQLKGGKLFYSKDKLKLALKIPRIKADFTKYHTQE